MPRDASIADPKAQLLHEHRKKNERWFENRWKMIDGPEGRGWDIMNWWNWLELAFYALWIWGMHG